MASMKVEELLTDDSGSREGTGLVYDRANGSGFMQLRLLPDGQLLVLGSVAAGWWGQPVLLRFNADGTLDTRFAADSGVPGVLRLGGEQAGQGVLQIDPRTGDVLVLSPTSSDLLQVYRVTAEGRPDENFGRDGFQVTAKDVLQSISGLSAVGLAIDEEGRLLLATTQSPHGQAQPHFMVQRLLSDGGSDASFNPPEQIDGTLVDFELLTDGTMVLGGMRTEDGHSGTVLARLDSHGQPVDAWGIDGVLELPVEGFRLSALAAQADGRLVLAGYSVTTIDAQTGAQTLSLSVVRLLPDGRLDSSFNPEGSIPGVLPEIGGLEISEWPYVDFTPPLSLSVNAAGQALLAVPQIGGFALTRLDTDGRLDSSFNPAGTMPGVIEFETGAKAWLPIQAALGPSGTVVFGTTMPDPATGAHGSNLMGRLQSDGALDTDFGLPAEALLATYASDLLPATMMGSSILGYGGVDWVTYQGALANYLVERSESWSWHVSTVGGFSQQLDGVERLRFADAVLALDIHYATTYGLIADMGLGAAGMALALARMLYGDAAVEDRALIGKVIAYLDALSLETVLEILDSDGTLSARMGDPEPSALLQTVYSRFTGEALDASLVPALAERFGYSAPQADQSLSENLAGMLRSEFLLQVIREETVGGMLSYQSLQGWVVATDGDDVMKASAGGSRLDGARGTDEVLFDAVRSRFAIEQSEHGVMTVDGGAHGASELRHIERLRFPDTVLAFDLGPDEAAGQAVRLLVALGGAGAMGTPGNLLGQAIALVDLLGARGTADTLVASGLTAALAGGDSLEALIDLLYRNLTDEAPVPTELAWTVDWAESQQMDAADVLLFVADLPLTASLIGVDELARDGVAYQTVYSFG